MGKDRLNRRAFLKTGSLALGAGFFTGASAFAGGFTNKTLQAWSCGGLAEAFQPANHAFEQKTGATIAYTGAFAGALGKSLLSGTAQTEVFAPRVLELALKLKAQGKMRWFEPLCFTRYVVATPKGNAAGIEGIADLGRDGVRTVLTPDASPPGGKASLIIMEKAGVIEKARKNAVQSGDCVQTAMTVLADGKADAAVIEQRISRLPCFAGRLEILPIPEKYIPPAPVPFTIGMMKWAKNADLAEAFIKYILSEKSQRFFEAAGFIHARSSDGRRLTRKYGVIDA